MNHRRVILKAVLAFVVVVALTLMSQVAWTYWRLTVASKRIVQEYSDQIDLISEYLIARPDWRRREEDWETEQLAVEQLRQAFADDVFHSVTVSIDGHHGLLPVKDWGVRKPGYVVSRVLLGAPGAAPEHKVYMGWSTEGERFYVYRGWVPEAQHMRCFELWLHRASLEGANN